MLKIRFVLLISINRGSSTASLPLFGKQPKSASPSLAQPTAPDGLASFARDEMERLRAAHKYSTASNYGTAIRSLLRFCRKEELPLACIDHLLIEAYSEWLYAEGVCRDTHSCYMRSLRALYNKAVKLDLVEQRLPFRNVFTGSTATRKRAVEKPDIDRLRSLDLKPDSFMQTVRDVFLFCLFACGMPFVDMAFLKKSQVADGYITYHRRKTGQEVRIRLEPCMEEIINRYASAGREYIFPFLTATDEETAYKEYRHKYTYYNKTLKRLGKRAGVKEPLSSYVARHTWATLAFRSSQEMEVVSCGLGHTDGKTSRIYVKGNENERLDKCNKRMLGEVLGGEPLYKSGERGDGLPARCEGLKCR